MSEFIHVCFANFRQPNDNTECPEVVWRNGKACRKCPVKEWYRNGWLKPQVDKDNKQIVENCRKERENTK